MDRSNPPTQRDMVYCHECRDEWYRDEHGLTCPECQSEFVEIIESQHDPRLDALRIPADGQPPSHQDDERGPSDSYAPDPDEGDIENLRFTDRGNGRMRLQGTLHTTVTPQQLREQQQPGGGGLMGLVSSFLGGALSGFQQQQDRQGQQPGQLVPQQQQQQQSSPEPPDHEPARPASAPGSPRGNTTVRHWHGPGVSITMTSSSGTLYPRNANAPQPFQPQPEELQQMMAQMFMNLGAMPGGGMAGPHRAVGSGSIRIGPGGPVFVDDSFGGGMPGSPFGNIFQLLGMAAAGGAGGAHGDYVFSQEALDRIATQIMEQHQMGNAPGPATEAAINSLPTKTITVSDFGDTGKAECSICIDEVHVGSQVTLLPCGHWFHFECVKAWLSEHDSCPQCRQGIMPKEGGANATQSRRPNQAPAVDMHAPQYQQPRSPLGNPPGGTPGTFPFPTQDSRSGGAGAAERAGVRRSNSTGGERRGTGQASGSNATLFGRMREVFDGGNDGVGASGQGRGTSSGAGGAS